jgi:hypothetical protein
MNRVTREIGRGTRIVSGVEVAITELIWDNDGRSFEVHRTDTGEDLTEDVCFDALPSDEQVGVLLDWTANQPGRWVCRGCGTSIDAADPDMVADHVRDCDLVDGAGNPAPGGRRDQPGRRGDGAGIAPEHRGTPAGGDHAPPAGRPK